MPVSPVNGHSPAGRKSRLPSRILARISPYLSFISGLAPAKLVALGYLTYLLAGWVLLCLPWAEKGAGGTALDHLFIAMSALSTTGLATISIADNYSLFGQLVVLALIQVGGLGYMTLGSFILLSRKSELTPLRHGVGKAVFSLPESFRMDKFIKSVVRFTVAIELIGAVLLYVLFRRASVPGPLYSAVFHSVSAFCTAGFSLNNLSFVPFAGDFWVNVVIAALSYLGAIGFIVCVDYWRMFRGKAASVTLTSKIIVRTTLWLSIIGTLLLFLAEPSFQTMPVNLRILASFFQCMTAMTTVGFNSVSIAALSKSSILLLIVLMIIGASPAGTGGGIKSTTFSAIWGVMWSAARGEKEVQFWGKTIPVERVWMAFASAGFYLFALVVGAYFFDLAEKTPFDENFFEAASALGTVGLSMGITAGLGSLGKIILVFLMYCGRVGPLTFGAALFFRQAEKPAVQDSDIAI
jgi:trk system potassium uptake protein TrkH